MTAETSCAVRGFATDRDPKGSNIRSQPAGDRSDRRTPAAALPADFRRYRRRRVRDHRLEEWLAADPQRRRRHRQAGEREARLQTAKWKRWLTVSGSFGPCGGRAVTST